MEGADEVLAAAFPVAAGLVDAGFAADGGIDHGEERGGDLDEGEAAEECCREEAGDVTDDAAAESNQGCAAVDVGGEEGVIGGEEGGEVFVRLAGGKDVRDGEESGEVEGLAQVGEVERGDGGVCDDEGFGGG